MAEFKLGRLRFVWKGEWTTATAYVKDDIVRYGANTYVCVSAHTSAANFYTDSDASKWELMTSGLSWKTDEWTTGTFYAENDVVRYGGKVYICVDGHTASSLFYTDFDAGDWQLLVDGIQWKTAVWGSANYYKEGDLVRHGGKVYICIDGHSASPDFYTDLNSNKWQLFADGTQWKTDEWTASIVYKEGDLVRHGGKVYICVVGHTANSTQRGGFYNDLTAMRWQLYADGLQYRGVWDTAAYYKLGDVVRYGAKSYICVSGHEADSDFYVDFDLARWELFNDGQQYVSDWENGTYYKEGDIVKHGGSTYICLDGHFSDSSMVEGFDRDIEQSLWQEFSAGFDWKNQWVTGTYYKLNDLVRYGAKAYICVDGHVAAEDFYTDVDTGRWQLLVDGQQWKTSAWQIGTLYKEGDLVRYGGRVYICVNGHTSTAVVNRFDIDFDNGEWQLFSDGTQWKTDPWTAGEYYKTGDIVKYGGKTYIAVNDHEADANESGGFYTDLDANNWDLYADGTEWRGDWMVQTYYRLGDIVRYDGNVYICQIPHTSANTIQEGLEFDLDLDSTQAKWDIFSEGFKYKGEWLTDTKYNINDVVKFGGSLYICVGYHTSDISSFEEQYWNILLGGLEFEDTWSPSVEYQIGDIVTYGGYSYVAASRNTARIPPGFPNDWELLTTGFKVTGEWSATRSYKVGELVKYGGNSYVAVVETVAGQKPTNNDGSTSILWEIVAPGFKWRGEWTDATAYRLGDAVRWASNSYVCVLDHTSDESSINQPDNDSEGIYWEAIAEGGEGNKLARRGDLLTRDAIQNKRLPRGLAGQVLQVQDKDVVWDYFNVVDNVYYVTTDGIDSPERGTTLQTPFRTIKYATEYILADEANRAPATIFVKTGTFREELPIIIPANVAVVGDELRSTRIEPAVGRGIDSVDIVAPGSGYTTAPTVTFQNPQLAGGVAAEGYATISSGQVTGIVITKAGSGYTSAPVVTLTGGGFVVEAAAAAVLKTKLYSQTDMFYMRDGSGLRNCTVAGLNVDLGPVNQYLTRRPETDCSYTSLDPGAGPGDETTWIVNRSPYVQNVTTFGNGAVGMKIDGSLHNGGAKTMVCNDFTQVISDGIGIWATNQGRVEAVSVFSYYAHLGYLAEDGGVIRGTNGNCSYGTFGVAAEGVDPSEVSRLAKVDNRRQEADVINTFVDGDGIVVLEYGNAGTDYQSGNTAFEFGGSGVANSIVVSNVNVVNGGVNQVRVLDAGEGWLSAINNAQNGDDTSIRLSASDVQVTDSYKGERIVLIDGQGVGQYGYITRFNGGTKIATVAKESFKPLVVTATSAVNNRLTTTNTATLSLNQAVTFENGDNLLGGLVEGQVYYVKAKPTSTEFTLSETVGGAELILTTDSGTMNLHSAGWESLYAQPIETVLDTTTRYIIEPRVVFSTGEGATATGVISKGVDQINLSSNGGYYQTAPTVIISGTEANSGDATATAIISGSVEQVKIKDGGSGYTGTPGVQFIGGGLANGSPNHAVGTAVVTGKITSVAVVDGGTGYTTAPEVQISGPGYNGDAYISAKITNIVGSILVTNNGSNYITVPTVTLVGGGGTGAEAVANLNAQVTGFTVVEGGSGYTDITTSVSIVPAAGDTSGGGATATAVIDNGVVGGPGVITGLTLTNSGSGYTKPPIVIITSTGLGQDAEVTADILGVVQTVTVTQGGSGYNTAPNVVFSSGTAQADAYITGSVSELEIINGGTGFTSTASLTIAGESPGTGATAVATVSRVVHSVNITSPGSGYTSAPVVSISGGGGTGALATSVLHAAVQSVTVNTPGKNYTTVPTIAFAGAHNFKSIVAGEAYYKSASGLVAISNLQLTQTLAAMDHIKTLAYAIATNTDPATYQSQISRTGTATAPAGAYDQTVFWVDVIKALVENGADNSIAAGVIEDNRSFIIAETSAYAASNISGGVVYNDADLRKRTRILVDAIVYDLTNGTVERTVSLGQKYAYLFANELSESISIIDFIDSLLQDIILNVVITPANTESAVQVFAELLASEITAPTAITNLINLLKSTINLNSTIGDVANSTYTDLLVDNKVWIQAEVIEYIKATYPNFDYNQSLCGRDVGLIVDAIAHDVRYSQSAIAVASATTTNVLSGITVVTGGEGYGQGTTVSFTGDLGTGSTPAATPIITDGVITGFNITQPGKGYTVAPSVSVNADTGTGAFARVLVLGEAVQEFRIIRPGSGYSAPPYVKLVDPNNSVEGRWQVRIGNGVLDQPTFSSRGSGYLAARTLITSPTGYADNFQVGEFVYVKNLTNVPTPGANLQFGDNPQFYKLVTIRELSGNTGLIGGRSLIVANRSFVQEQIISYIDTTFPLLDYDRELCKRDVGLIVDAITADIFGDTERGIEAGKSYFRSQSSLAAITGAQLPATIAAIEKIEDYLIDIVQNIDIPRNQLFELQVKEPNITNGEEAINPLKNTIDIILDIIQNGSTIYAVQDLLLDNKPYIQAEVIAFVNTTYPDFVYNVDLCERDVGLIVDAIAYDLFAGFGANYTTPNVPSGLVRSREAGLRYYSNSSALLAITEQLDETVAAIQRIAEVAIAVVTNVAPTVVYQTAVSQITNLSVAATPTLTGRIQDSVDEIVNIIENGLDVLPQGSYSARFQVSPPFTVDNVPNNDDTITIRSKYSQVRISGHDFLNVGTGNKAATNYPGLPVNAPEPENEVLEAGGGRCFYTSTDQDGNFRVGELFRVEQSTGIATLNADAFNLSGLNELTLGGINIGGTGATITEFSTDSTFLANSDSIVPTQRAIRTYIASQLGSGGGNLAVNAITAGDVQITGNEISTNFPDGLEIIVPDGVFLTEIVESTSPTTGSLVVDGGVGIGGDLNVGDDVNIGGDLVVSGNLTVNGDLTSLNVGTISIEDKNIVLANGAVNAAAADGAGITVEGPATSATMLYEADDDTWNFNKVIKAPSIQATIIGSSSRASGSFTTLAANNNVTFTKGDNSTGSNNGTLVVTGGAGITQDLFVGGKSTSVGLEATGSVILSPLDASVQINPSGTGGVVISPTGSAGLAINPTAVGTINNVNIGGVTRGSGNFTTIEANGNVLITSATAATSVDTGALQVDGGVGINGALYAGSIQNTPIGSTTASTGRFTTGTFTSNTASTSVSTGAVTVAGGLGVSGALWAGSINVNGGGIDNTPIGATTPNTGAFTTLTSNGATTFTANTASTNTTTGAVVVTGGVGIGGALNVGGQLTVTGNLVVNGTTTTINSTTITVDDILVELGDVASPTDTTANGGGILLKGATNKTITWVQSTGYWTSNQPFQASSLQNTPIGNTTANTGAFTSLTANGAVTFTQNTASTTTGTGTLVVTGGVGVSGQVTATTLSGNHTGGSGTFTSLSASSTVGLSPANASVTISPTGTGTVTINPATAGTINNTSIGATTAASGRFTTLTATSTFSLTDTTESTTTTTGALVVSGGVGIAKNLNVGGTLRAISKSFLIDHPTRDGYKLQYGSLEGPENGVYVRGRTQTAVIELPDYWTALVDSSTITVNLTATGGKQDIWVEKIEDNRVYIGGDLVDCFYTVYGERKDIDKLTVEFKAE